MKMKMLPRWRLLQRCQEKGGEKSKMKRRFGCVYVESALGP